MARRTKRGKTGADGRADAEADLLRGLPDAVQSVEAEAGGADGVFLRLPSSALENGLEGLRLPGLKRFVALARHKKLWWTHPVFGTDESEVPARTQFLLWEREDGRYGILLPLVEGDVLGLLEGRQNGLALAVEGYRKKHAPEAATLLYAAAGADLLALPEAAVADVARFTKAFRLRREKRIPDFVDYVGWCTWDAFYQKVDAGKVKRGLNAFRKAGFVPPLLILDDGWLDTDYNRLRSFDAEPKKFPDGLAPLVRLAKETYGVKRFLTWQTLQGYWRGIDPEGALAERYRIRRGGRFPLTENTEYLHLVDARDVHRFYQDWARHLHEAGVDGIKVDYQSEMETFTAGKMGRGTTMRAYQEALQGAALSWFDGNLIHCMCHSHDVAYNMFASVVLRNSDDFFPKKPESHQFHIHANAMNSLWTRTFALPDWDMFHSDHEAAAFHAAARAVSGGPVYVSDKPGKTDTALLGRLCTSEGRTLRCDEPARPVAQSVLTDTYTLPHPLLVQNRCGPAGVLGLFHCWWNEEKAPVTGAFRADEVTGLAGRRFAAWFAQTETLRLLTPRERVAFTLRFREAEVVSLSPVDRGVAPLGLLEKFVPVAAVGARGWRADGSYAFALRDGGRIGLYSRQKPRRVRVDGKPAAIRYQPSSGLVTLRAGTGAPVEVTVEF